MLKPPQKKIVSAFLGKCGEPSSQAIAKANHSVCIHPTVSHLTVIHILECGHWRLWFGTSVGAIARQCFACPMVERD